MKRNFDDVACIFKRPIMSVRLLGEQVAMDLLRICFSMFF